MLSSCGSLSVHQPVQWLQNLQFYSLQDCGRVYSRVSASSENQIMGQSVRLSMGLCCHYESVEFKNVSVAMAMITPEKVNDTCLGFNPFHITKTLYIRILNICKMLQYGGYANVHCCCHSNLTCVQILCFYC